MSEVKLVEEILSQMNINQSRLNNIISRYLKGEIELSKNIYDENDILIKIDKTKFHFVNIEVNNKNIFILSRLNKIIFEECSFKINEWDYDNLDAVFFYCKFKMKLTINKLNLLNNEEKFVFIKCIFEKRIEIIDTIIDINLFKNCKFSSIYARDSNFKKTIFEFDYNYEMQSMNEIIINLTFYNCIVEEEFNIKKIKQIDVAILKTRFLSDFSISMSEIKNLLISDCIFNNKVTYEQCNIEKTRIFGSLFRGVYFSYHSKYEKIFLLENLNFENNVDFIYNKFYLVFSPSFCTFNKGLNLNETLFENIDLSYSSILGKVNFNKSKSFSKNDITISEIENRETARIIKDSFEQQNNIIEANKYYAIEMQKREDELSWKDNFLEKLVFKAHGLASNHSQNWLLPIFWIIFLGLLNSYFQPLDFYTMNHSEILYKEIFTGLLISLTTFVFLLSLIEHKIYYNYISSFFIILLVYLIFTNDIYFSDFANSVNPFSIMTKGEELSFRTLIYKVTIAYLIYQLIVSIRQNTRRK